MMNLQDRNIATKIGVVIGLFSLLLALCAGFALFGLAKNNRIVQTVLGDQGKSLFLATDASERKTHIHQRAFELLGESDPTQWASLQSAFEKEASDLRAVMSNLKPLMDSEDVKLFSPIESQLNKYVDMEKQGYVLRQSGHGKDFEDLLQGDMTKAFEVMDSSFDALVGKQKHDMDQATSDIDEAATATQWQTVALSASGLLGTIVAAFLLVRLQITRPLAVLASSMGKLASGDISIDVVGQERKDEIGALANALQVFKENGLKLKASEAEAKRLGLMTAEERARADAQQAMTAREQKQVVESLATGLESLSQGQLTFRLREAFASDYEKLRSDFNGAMEKLQDTMKVVATTTSAIRSGTGEMSSASDDLSRRTEQQAASLEETAAALDEITATVRKTAEGSKHAREVVGQTKQAAERSGEVVRQAVVAMSGIETSSSQIGNIIGVIDEIAFQTNLLALNAGVEAARAGDAGRGFAVVASEVRALAQRSADAAKEIKALILASSTQVEQGVNLVGETGKALELIVTQVAEINGIVTEIAASAQEQAVGLDQVNTAVNQMDQVTQQNAAMVEESTAASHALSQEAEELTRLMSRFEVGQVGGRPSRRPVPKAVQPVKTATRPVAVPALKTRGRGGAALNAVAVASDWQEF